MEPASFAVGIIGLAGLFSTCLEAVDKVQSYRSFATDSSALDTQFNAAKVRLEKWGSSVGFSHGKPLDKHHPALDDEQVNRSAYEIFSLIKTICASSDARKSRPVRVGTGDGIQGLHPSLATAGAPGESKRRKLGWSFGGKLKRTEQVELLKQLVQSLHDLVPPQSLLASDNSNRAGTLGPGTAFYSDHTWSTEFRQLIARFENRTQRDLHAWLGRVPDERYKDSLKERLEGTCSWVLSRPAFMQWVSSDFTGAAKLLWIHGPAGFGKTVLCAKVVEHLTETLSQPVAYFFFSSDSSNREDPFMAVRSWISQVMSQHEGAFEYVLQRQEADPDPVAPRHTIMSVFENLLRIVPGCTFAVDGLDECTHLHDSSTSVAKFLRDVTDAAADTNTRLLLVSRPLPDIQHEIKYSDGIDFSEYKILPDDVRSDNVAYSRDIVEKKLSNKNDNVRSSLSEAMAERCEGQFLWLKMQGKSLRRGMSKKQLQDAVKDTPTELNRVYDHSWRTITLRSESERSRAFALLRWAAFALRPLTIYEITGAVIISETKDLCEEEFPDPVDDDYVSTEIVELCGPFLEIRNDHSNPDPGRWTVHLPHFTVKEYLLCSLPVPVWLQPNDGPRASLELLQNTLLANACLHYISFRKVWEQIPDDQSPSLYACFRQYAASTWHRHLNDGVGDNAELLTLAVEFFTNNGPVWDGWRASVESQEPKDEGLEANSVRPGPLYCAVKLGLTDLAIALIEEEKCDINEGSDRGPSAFALACANGMTKIVNALIQKDENFATISNDGWAPLLAASYSGHIEIVELLLEKGADITVASKHGWTPLNAAADEGHVEVVKLLLKKGADTAVANKDGWTPLNSAADGGHAAVVKLLLEAGADISIATHTGWTPLNTAANKGHVEVAKLLLLEKGADINISNENGWTPLNLAAEKGHIEVVKLLLGKGADTTITTMDGWTPLHAAANKGDIEVVKLLLEKGADITVISKDGWTPLTLAADEGHIEVVKLLLGKGADITIGDKDRQTPLSMAAYNGHVEVVKLLLENGADITIGNKDRQTPLYMAACKGHTEIVKLLVEKGADITIANSGGWTPLNAAADNGHTEVVKLLLEKGADITVASKNGWTPLITAADEGYIEVVKLLLEEGADTTAANDNGWTPLFAAAYKGHTDLVSLLLEKEVDVTIANNDGWTPINAAAFNGHIEVVKLLLENGADITIGNKDRQTPLYVAACKGHTEIVKMLVEKGADTTVVTKGRWTPLNAAADYGHTEVVKLLLEKGAGFAVTSKNG